jgi:hypothetical protein
MMNPFSLDTKTPQREVAGNLCRVLFRLGMGRLEAVSHEQQDEQDYYNQSEPAARVIAPASGVRPRGQRTQKHQNQQHEQYSAKHLNSPSKQRPNESLSLLQVGE